jgi:hypothetical protein
VAAGPCSLRGRPATRLPSPLLVISCDEPGCDQWPAATRSRPRARSTRAHRFLGVDGVGVEDEHVQPIVRATVMAPNRTHRNIARGRRFPISSRSVAGSLGFRAATNASAENSAFIAGQPALVIVPRGWRRRGCWCSLTCFSYAAMPSHPSRAVAGAARDHGPPSSGRRAHAPGAFGQAWSSHEVQIAAPDPRAMHPGGHRNCRFDGVAHLGRSGLRGAAWRIAGS